VEEAHEFRSVADILAIASTADSEFCASLAADLENSIRHFLVAFAKIAGIVEPNVKDVFGIPEIERIPLPAVCDRINKWMAALEEFNHWVNAREAIDSLRSFELKFVASGLMNGSIHCSQLVSATNLLIAEALWRGACQDNPRLELLDGKDRSDVVAQFRSLDRKRIQLSRAEVLARYLERRPSGEAGEMGIVRAEIAKKRRHLPLRKLMEHAGSAVKKLKPVFLMSPLSVAQFLPPGRISFDLVIIDEASQVPPEEALGAVARGYQLIVVGDEKQLPPTNFFKMVCSDEDGEETESEPTAKRPSDFESILKLANARSTSERILQWHYRSRHPSLIALSNKECYGGRLLLPPSPLIDTGDIGLSIIKTPRGNYDRGGSGRNPVEADQIAAAVEEHLRNRPERSLGIACFSVAQRDAIEDALYSRGLLSSAEAFAPRGERLFVKNLEAVQGDERDVIFISIGYGPDAQGRMTAGFGPLSADGGERRLNVLISRARSQCVVFSSITAGDIPADAKPRGTRMLREFLHYAETKNISAGQVNNRGFDSPFEEAIAITVQQGGYDVRPQIGVSGFRIDLGVLDPSQPGRFIMGIECDGAAYHSGRSARDRDRLRQEVLEGLGWKLYRIWSTDWFRSPQREAQRLLTAIEDACRGDADEAKSALKIEISQASSDPANHISTAVPDFSRIDNNLRSTLPSTPRSPEPYKEFKLKVPPQIDLFEIGKKELGELVSKVVANEGPIHTEEVARRVREAFSLGRTGRRILETVREALEQVVREGTISRDGEFWSSNNDKLKYPRLRRDASPSLRRADRIAPEEYRLAIRTVLKEAAAATKSEVAIAVARAFGFERTGNDLDAAISDQINFMVQSGEMENVEGKLRFKAA
jgi:very-short-patch-repair endonuclease